MSAAPVALDDVLALTERVQAAITAGDWLAAAKLEQDRRAMLARLLEQHRDAGLDVLRERLSDLQTRNNHLIGELYHHRRRLVREATTVRTGRQAVRAYAAHEPPSP